MWEFPRVSCVCTCTPARVCRVLSAPIASFTSASKPSPPALSPFLLILWVWVRVAVVTSSPDAQGLTTTYLAFLLTSHAAGGQLRPLWLCPQLLILGPRLEERPLGATPSVTEGKSKCEVETLSLCPELC